MLITPKLSANCTTNDGTGLADTTSIRYLQSSRVKAMGEDSLFVYDNTTEIANLHHMTEVLTILPTDVSRTELIIDFPTPIFSLR